MISTITRTAAAALLAASALTGLVQADSAAAAAGPVTAGYGWRVYAAIAQHRQAVLLGSIDAVGPKDAWAAGLIAGQAEQHQRALLAHWNGVAWRRVPLPARAAARLGRNVGAVFTSARSNRDVWVFSQTGSYLRQYRGTWIQGKVPVARNQNILFDQAVVFRPSDVWAFGVRFAGPVSRIDLRPYAARFNGRGWVAVPVPGRGALAVSAVSPRQMWGVTGTSIPGSGLPATPRVVRWDGRAWRLSPVQPSLPRHATLTSILAESACDVWLGGSRPNRKGGASELARRWNGMSWVRADPPAAPSEDEFYLAAIVRDGAGGVWAESSSLGSAVPGPTRMWHFAGGGWRQPQVLSARWLLLGLAWVPRTRSVWGVAENPGDVKGLLILHGAVPR